MDNKLNIALSKGRILEDCIPLLAQAGIELLEDPNQSRKLILDTSNPDIKIIIIRATDVPTYVQYGAADLGVAGKDVLMEYEGDGLYELLDLKIARCRLMVAEPVSLAEQDDPDSWTHLRIATKYANTAKRHFAKKGIQTDIIKLYGSMELAPLVGLSDRIVDLVSTGKTLKANGLIEVEHIADISSRLVANKASLRLKHKAIRLLVGQLAEAVGG